jgi:hypothetical protein
VEEYEVTMKIGKADKIKWQPLDIFVTFIEELSQSDKSQQFHLPGKKDNKMTETDIQRRLKVREGPQQKAATESRNRSPTRTLTQYTLTQHTLPHTIPYATHPPAITLAFSF